MKAKHSKKKNKLPRIGKNIKDFLLSEEGKITKKDVVKIGMFLAVLSLMPPSEAKAGSGPHSNSFYTTPNASGGTGGHTSHTSHASHSSHGSHGSHSNGGTWC